MRLSLTGLIRRCRGLAVATAAMMIVGTVLAPAAFAGGPDGTLCHQETSRVKIPANFTMNACFDGHTLVLRNRTSDVVRVYAVGDITGSARFPDKPSVSTLLTTLITNGDTIPPDSRLQLSLGPGTTDVEIEVALDANRKYDLYALLLSYLPGVSSYEDVIAAEESTSAAFANRETCDSHASNWLGKVGCAAGMAGNVMFATDKLLAQVGIDIAAHAGEIGSALINTVWLGWDQMGQSQDLDIIAKLTPTLHIAAVPGAPAHNGGGASAGPAFATASNSNGQMLVRLANFPLGTTYYFCHSGTGYPTGGTIASHSSVNVTSPSQNLGALCSGSGNFWIGFQATDGHDYYSNQATLG